MKKRKYIVRTLKPINKYGWRWFKKVLRLSSTFEEYYINHKKQEFYKDDGC